MRTKPEESLNEKLWDALFTDEEEEKTWVSGRPSLEAVLASEGLAIYELFDREMEPFILRRRR